LFRAIPLLFLFTSLVVDGYTQTKTIDSLERMLALQPHDTTELRILNKLAFEYSRKDLMKMKQMANRILRTAHEPAHVNFRSAAFSYLISYHYRTGALDSAQYYLSLSEKVALDNPANLDVNHNFNQAAGLFYKDIGDLKKALPYMVRNLELRKTEDENRAGQLLNLGNLYIRMGNYKDAVDYHLQALKLFEKLGNKRGQSFAQQSLANDFLYMKQYGQARQYYERSYALKKELNDSRGLINALGGLADVNKEAGNLEAAEKQYKEVQQLARNLKLPLEVSRLGYQTGLLYKKMSRFVDARTQLEEALQLARSATDSVLMAKIQSELIGIDLLERKNSEDELSLQQSLNTAIRSGDRMQQSIEYARLSEYYAQRKQFDKAFELLTRHEQLDDSLKGNALILQMKELEEQYENEKKEREIELLKKEQEVQALTLSRQRANITIISITLISVIVFGVLLINRYRILNHTRRQVEIEKVRNNIARDLHDDIGSTLSSINIMSQVAINENGNAVAQLQKISGHASRMMESMSDIVWSINPKNDSLEQVVAKMKEFTAEILEPKEIAYDFQVAPEILGMKLDVEKRKNIFLIFKEAINNAAKYSEGKTVHVTLTRGGNLFHLKVGDDGKGFSHNGIGTGNGLRNMAARAQAIGGMLEKESIPGAGTTIALQVPIT
jgi:two-component system sensor histidine kinase UhpB